MHTRTSTHARTHTHAHTPHPYMETYTTHARTHTIDTYTHAYTHVHTHYIHMHTHRCIHMFAGTHMHTQYLVIALFLTRSDNLQIQKYNYWKYYMRSCDLLTHCTLAGNPWQHLVQHYLLESLHTLSVS